ncbi:CYTH domain-containing protein [Shewanella sp. NIFS-20-20]|nr:CYTH domain-containing protein [Shewanella sp. NIFS-20-20]
MPAEIELKLFFPSHTYAEIISHFSSLAEVEIKAPPHLSNAYFDTHHQDLRCLDMGLRVRVGEHVREQTIKTAGKVVGGIHSRPEYNVDIENDFPDLSLFPAHIWPQPAMAAQWQPQLYCLFHTDFERRSWHICVDTSLVEVALDRGMIRTDDGRQEPICEIEFELLSGDSHALLVLAQGLAVKVPVAIARASKAQRGYQLAGLSPLPTVVSSPALLGMTERQAHIVLLEYGLDAWPMLMENLAAIDWSAPPRAAHTAVMQASRGWLALINVIELLAQDALAHGAPQQAHFSLLKQHLAATAEVLRQCGVVNGTELHWQHTDTRAQHTLVNHPWAQQLAALQQLPCIGQIQLALLGQLLQAQR